MKIVNIEPTIEKFKIALNKTSNKTYEYIIDAIICELEALPEINIRTDIK